MALIAAGTLVRRQVGPGARDDTALAISLAVTGTIFEVFFALSLAVFGLVFADGARAQPSNTYLSSLQAAADFLGSHPTGLPADGVIADLRALSASPTAHDQAAFAWLYLAEIEARSGQFALAKQAAEHAVLRATEANRWEAEYRARWQVARLTAGEEALRHFRQAIGVLEAHTQSVVPVQGFYARWMAPLYDEYADALFRKAHQTEDEAERRLLLIDARNVIEGRRVAEIEDYFARQCLASEDTLQTLPSSRPRAAMLYLARFSDRLEVLYESASASHAHSVPVSRQQIDSVARDYYMQLADEEYDDEVVALGKQLYTWIVAPAEAWLAAHRIQTIVSVPDGVLRAVPLAALHDGKGFLLDRFEFASTPALRLTRLRETVGELGRAWIGGLSVEVDSQFGALPSVPVELTSVSQYVGGEPALNEAFNQGRIESELRGGDFTIAHIATHGYFSGNVDESFLLLHDGRYSMPKLRAALSDRRQQSLELLVLSACQTAAGDDRAALGLAGIAVQMGARSALASLWSISDGATATMVDAFYRELSDAAEGAPAGTRRGTASALRAAQQTIRSQPQYDHPTFWAPYVLIGEWQ